MSPDQKPVPPSPEPNQKPVEDPTLQVSPDLQFQEVPASEPASVAPAAPPGQAVAAEPPQPAAPQFKPPVPLEPTGAGTGPVILGAKRKRSKAPLFILVVLLLLGGGAGAYLYLNGKNAKTSTGTVTIKPEIRTKKAAQTNSWTGKANNFNWGDPANWTLGTPANGQNLEIDMSKVTQPKDQYGTTELIFQNNIANLTIGKLTFDGNVESILANVKGQPLTITGGIDFTTKQTGAGSGIPQVQFRLPLTLSADQTIRATDSNKLTFTADKDDQAIDIADKTIQFVADKNAGMYVSEAIKGTGTLLFPKATSPSGSFSFINDSPEFTGKVSIDSGNFVQAGNHTTASKTDPQAITSFGKAAIEVKDGGTLGLTTVGTATATLANDLTLGGRGVAAVAKGVGDYQGALSACLTKAQEGCDLGVNVTLSGKVTLAADTQFGAGSIDENGTVPKSTTVTYAVPQLNKNGHTLSAVDDSKAVIK